VVGMLVARGAPVNQRDSYVRPQTNSARTKSDALTWLTSLTPYPNVVHRPK
jgi:hypothetical protein